MSFKDFQDQQLSIREQTGWKYNDHVISIGDLITGKASENNAYVKGKITEIEEDFINVEIESAIGIDRTEFKTVKVLNKDIETLIPKQIAEEELPKILKKKKITFKDNQFIETDITTLSVIKEEVIEEQVKVEQEVISEEVPVELDEVIEEKPKKKKNRKKNINEDLIQNNFPSIEELSKNITNSNEFKHLLEEVRLSYSNWNTPGSGIGYREAIELILQHAPEQVIPIQTVFGRTGDVVSTSGDYNSNQISNVSIVTGSNVSDALEHIEARVSSLALSAGAVVSVFGRADEVVATSGDYVTSYIINDSNVVGTNAADALNTLQLSASSISVLYDTKSISVKTVSADYTVLTSDRLIRCSETITITLPASSGSGFQYHIKDVGTGNITISAAGTDKIDDQSTLTISSQYTSVNIVDSVSGTWDII